MVERVDTDDLRVGDKVIVEWGLVEAVGTVAEIYGPPLRRHVVVMLSPEVSGDIVDEEVTVAVPLAALTRAAATVT